MRQQPIQDPRVLEAIEACRPGTDDLSDPGLAFLASHLASHPELDETFERLQRLDASLTRAFQDVPVPDGLADRIKARLAPRTDERISSDGGQEAVTPSPPRPVVGHEGRWKIGRKWLLGVAGGAAAVAVAVALLVFRSAPPVKTAPEVWDGAIGCFEGDWDQQGQLASQAQPPIDYPAGPDFDLRRFPRVRWRWVPDFLGQKAVAYDLTPPEAPRATLYVTSGNVTGLPNFPPPRPPKTTGNRSVAAWQTNGLLYVLVVEGGPRRYQQLLPRTTWT